LFQAHFQFSVVVIDYPLNYHLTWTEKNRLGILWNFLYIKYLWSFVGKTEVTTYTREKIEILCLKNTEVLPSNIELWKECLKVERKAILKIKIDLHWLGLLNLHIRCYISNSKLLLTAGNLKERGVLDEINCNSLRTGCSWKRTVKILW